MGHAPFYSAQELSTMFYGVIVPELSRATVKLRKNCPDITPENVHLIAKRYGLVRMLNELCPFTITELAYLLPRVKLAIVKRGYLDIYKGIMIDEQCDITGADEEDVTNMVNALEVTPHKEFYIL